MSSELFVSSARGWIGTPYRHQASVKGIGADCLGLVRGVWREVIGPEPFRVPAYPQVSRRGVADTVMIDMAAQHLVPVSAPHQVGDILFFRLNPKVSPRHCAIRSTPDHMVHAVEGFGVVETQLTPQWQRRLCASFRLPQG